MISRRHQVAVLVLGLPRVDSWLKVIANEHGPPCRAHVHQRAVVGSCRCRHTIFPVGRCTDDDRGSWSRTTTSKRSRRSDTA